MTTPADRIRELKERAAREKALGGSEQVRGLTASSTRGAFMNSISLFATAALTSTCPRPLFPQRGWSPVTGW